MKLLIWIILPILFALALAVAWRVMDHRADREEMDRLLAQQPTRPAFFSTDMLAGLPDPARKYFTFSIAPGTPLHTVAMIEMTGEFRLGTAQTPRAMEMTAQQVLAASHGFVWKMDGGAGFGHVSGSDSGKWTRFWLNDLLPVARTGGSTDHKLSAFGRYAAEAVIWTPAAVLPGPNVRWETVDDQTARMIMQSDGMEQAVDVTVAPDGRPTQISLQRWSDQNPDGVHRYQGFGGTLSNPQTFAGFQISTHVEAGHFFGAPEYFPFFIADITDVLFPMASE